MGTADLPHVNAALNGMATLLLVAGYVAIRKRRVALHRALMGSAFVTSILFLVSYLTYHALHGSRRFPGEGAVRTVYLIILVTHVVLAAVVPFLASWTLWRALRGDIERHRRIARITWPIWIYVSVTGVVVYAMLYRWPLGS